MSKADFRNALKRSFDEQSTATTMSDDRIGACYHEAGHAVVAWALGVRVKAVAVAVDGDEAAGKTEIDPATGTHLSQTDHLTMCLAGIEAQALFGCATHEWAGLSDLAKVIEILGEEISEEESADCRKAAYKRAHELLSTNRTKVVRLAERLFDKPQIDEFEFDALMSSTG